jgi:hypothetical protein
MQTGKLILGAAAALVTIASSFAFKSARVGTAHTLYTFSDGETCVKKACFTNNGVVANPFPCLVGAPTARTGKKIGGVTFCTVIYTGKRTISK